MEDEEVDEVSLKILDGRKAKVEDISKIVHKGKKILSFKSGLNDGLDFTLTYHVFAIS